MSLSYDSFKLFKISIKIQNISFMKMHFKMSSANMGHFVEVSICQLTRQPQKHGFFCLFFLALLFHQQWNSRTFPRLVQLPRTFEAIKCILHINKKCSSKTDCFQKKKLPDQNIYCQTSYIRQPLVGNKIVDHSEVAGVWSVGAAPTTSPSSTLHMASMDWAKTTERWDKKLLSLEIWCGLY